MESPVGASTSSFDPEMSDRLTMSCPPEAGTMDEELLPFKIERPERPGEVRLVQYCSTPIVNYMYELSVFFELFITSMFISFRHSPHMEVLPLAVMASPVNLDKLRSREKKWIHMLDNWRYFMDEKYTTIRDRCRKGIPPSIRGKAWKYLCGATYQMEVSVNRTVFDRCLRQPGDPKWIDDIEKDLNRQFPNHELFSRCGKFGDAGKEDLFQLLKAWTVLHPEEGYCQGQAPVASVLLMHMPLRDAFYCFVQICHRYLTDYYSPGLEAVQVDGDILVQLLKEKSRISYQHLKRQNVEPVLYMVEWFMCVYCRTLPWPTVLRVWDMFLCEGAKVLFKVAVVLFKYGLGTKEQCKQYPDLHSIVTRLRNLPQQITTEDFLVEKVCQLNLNDADLEKIHFRALKLRQIKIAQK
uniref:Rab-GAP TBC domain-containing protein n=1 Tax=Angiostrongylus cantonensis TaxID=6313 RepID=A0A0K0DCF2_ANGCA